MLFPVIETKETVATKAFYRVILILFIYIL